MGDLASGYHNFKIVDNQRHVLGIAIHLSEGAIVDLRYSHPVRGPMTVRRDEHHIPCIDTKPASRSEPDRPSFPCTH